MWPPAFLFLRTGVQFAPAANCRLHLPSRTSLREDRAPAGSDSFSKTEIRALVEKKVLNCVSNANVDYAGDIW